MLIPLKSFISKELLGIEQAKGWYVSEYLTYSFVLMCFLINGYQISSSVSILLLNFAVLVQLIIVLATCPYL
jgi:hypothetical protein